VINASVTPTAVVVADGHSIGILVLILLVVVIAIGISLYEKWVSKIDPQAKSIIYGLCGFLAFALIIITLLQMLKVI
jgi:predicted membrane channel-forming protein YqfA (hemolysin III family)